MLQKQKHPTVAGRLSTAGPQGDHQTVGTTREIRSRELRGRSPGRKGGTRSIITLSDLLRKPCRGARVLPCWISRARIISPALWGGNVPMRGTCSTRRTKLFAFSRNWQRWRAIATVPVISLVRVLFLVKGGLDLFRSNSCSAL